MNHSGDKRAHYAVWQLRLAIPRLLFVGSCCPLIFCPAATVMPGLNPLKAKRRQCRRLPTSTPCSVHCNAHETDFSLFIFPFRTFSNVFCCCMVSFWWLFTAAPFPKCIDWHIGWSQNDGFRFFLSNYNTRSVGPYSSDGGDGSCLCHALDTMPSSVECPRRSLPDMVTNMIATQQHSHI